MKARYHISCRAMCLKAYWGMFLKGFLGFLATGVYSLLFLGNIYALEQQAQPALWLQGERLAYDITWGWFSAGKAEILFEQQPQEEDFSTYRITARAWTEGVPFTLLERLQSSGNVTANGFRATRYVQQQRENDYKAHKTIEMDAISERAVYENHFNATPPYAYDMPADAQDMMSALYHLRMTVPNLSIKNIPMQIVTLGDVKPMLVEVGEPELLRVKSYAKNKQVVRAIRPHVPKSKQSWVIYITDDAQMLPIQIRLKSKFGTFKANLKGVNQQSTAPKNLPLEGSLF